MESKNKHNQEKKWKSERIFERIMFYANRKEWTLTRLSKEADLSEATLCSCRTTNGIPSVATLAKICDALNIKMEDFFAEEDNKPSTGFVIKEIEKMLEELKGSTEKETH